MFLSMQTPLLRHLSVRGAESLAHGQQLQVAEPGLKRVFAKLSTSVQPYPTSLWTLSVCSSCSRPASPCCEKNQIQTIWLTQKPRSHRCPVWQKQDLNVGLCDCKAFAFDYLAVLSLLPEIPSFLKLSLCPEAVAGFAWGSHRVWLLIVRLLWSLAIIAQQSPLKRNFICILTRTTKEGSLRRE